MVRRFVILRRRSDMSVAAFRAYWRNVHGPLIAQIPGLLRNTQYHVRSERLDDTEPEVDGIAELWFESEESQKRAYATEEYAAVVRDEPNLFEMDSRHVHPVMTEAVINVVGNARDDSAV